MTSDAARILTMIIVPLKIALNAQRWQALTDLLLQRIFSSEFPFRFFLFQPVGTIVAGEQSP